MIERDGLVARVKTDISPYLQRRMRETFEGHPMVGEVRGRGLLCAIELVADKQARSFYPDPGTVTISETEVDELVARAKDAIDRTAKDYGKM